MNEILRSILAAFFGCSIAMLSSASGLLAIIMTGAISLMAKFFLELCIDVKEILKELQKRNKPD